MERTPSDGTLPTGRPSRLLLVDNDLSVVYTFFRMLSVRGYQVSIARDAEAALRELDGSDFDAVLLDLRMPQSDGLVFLRRLRSHRRQSRIPVAVVTGDYFVDEAVLGELRGFGANVHFKPLGSDDLVDIIQRLLGHDRS
jgi:DNA-binding response OmpR family regulator